MGQILKIIASNEYNDDENDEILDNRMSISWILLWINDYWWS